MSDILDRDAGACTCFDCAPREGNYLQGTCDAAAAFGVIRGRSIRRGAHISINMLHKYINMLYCSYADHYRHSGRDLQEHQADGG